MLNSALARPDTTPQVGALAQSWEVVGAQGPRKPARGVDPGTGGSGTCQINRVTDDLHAQENEEAKTSRYRGVKLGVEVVRGRAERV